MRGTTNIGHSDTGRTSNEALRLAKLHLRDWGVLILLLILDRVLASLHPFYRFIGKYMLDDLRYPLKANTVPFWAVPVFDGVTDEGVCHGDPETIRDGHKSFPSGHAAWSFSGLGFFSLYLAGKIRIFDHKGHVSKLTIILAPLAVAAYIGLSRVNDYKHHWQDVFGGALLGLTVATLSYRQFFPALYHEFCMLPYRAHESRLTNNQNASAENQHAIHQSPTPLNDTVTDMEMGRIQHESS